MGGRLDRWSLAATPQVGTPVSKFEHMLKRLEEKEINAMLDETREDAQEDETPDTPGPVEATSGDNDTAAASGQPLKDEPLAEEITYDDFMKVDLRVARVIKAEHVEDADKLLRLTLSLGGEETRQVLAGIKNAYTPAELEGRLVIMVANLAPRTMRFGVSQGMITAAGPGGEEVFMLGIDDGALPGQRVH